MPAPAVSPRQLFAAEVSRPEDEINLARAALLVAKEEYPQLSIELYLARLDQIAEEVKDRLAEETAPLIILDELLRTVYEHRGFDGNRTAYYDPRNSFLNDVLDRGTGIPLTLAIVLLEVGWRLGLPLQGVNFPSHFLVRFKGDAFDLLVDPFEKGEKRFVDEAQGLLDRVYGGLVRVQSSFLMSASRREMLSRLLINLKGVYVNVRDDRRALAAVERLLMLRPDSSDENRARGMLLARLGRTEEAAEQLETYLEIAPRASDRTRIRGMVRDLRGGAPVDAPDLADD